MKPELAIDARLTLPKIDFDRTLAVMSQAAAPSAAARPATATPAAPAASSGGLPANLTLKAMLEIGELIYNKKPVRNVALELDAKGGAVAVPKLTATLPGDMVLQARSTCRATRRGPPCRASSALVGPKLRETLAGSRSTSPRCRRASSTGST